MGVLSTQPCPGQRYSPDQRAERDSGRKAKVQVPRAGIYMLAPLAKNIKSNLDTALFLFNYSSFSSCSFHQGHLRKEITQYFTIV